MACWRAGLIVSRDVLPMATGPNPDSVPTKQISLELWFSPDDPIVTWDGPELTRRLNLLVLAKIGGGDLFVRDGWTLYYNHPGGDEAVTFGFDFAIDADTLWTITTNKKEPPEFAFGAWIHVVVTFDGFDANIYWNGELDGTSTGWFPRRNS